MKKLLTLGLIACISYQFIQGFNPADHQGHQAEQNRSERYNINQARQQARIDRTTGRNIYQVLGVPYNATTAVIRRAWMNKARRLHPDRHHGLNTPEKQNMQQDMQQELQRVNHAYEILKDPKARAAYDAALSTRSMGGAAGAAASGQ